MSQLPDDLRDWRAKREPWWVEPACMLVAVCTGMALVYVAALLALALQ